MLALLLQQGPLIGLIQWLNFHTLEDDNRTALQGLQKKTDVFKKGHLKKEKMYAMYCDKSFGRSDSNSNLASVGSGFNNATLHIHSVVATKWGGNVYLLNVFLLMLPISQ